MKKHHVFFALLAIVLAVGLVLLLFPTSLPGFLQPEDQGPEIAHYMTPVDLDAYARAMDEYTSSGGVNPALSWEFETKTRDVPVGSSTEAFAAETAANEITLGGGPARAAVTHFMIVNGTAYVVFNIDEDGWAGVSFAKNKIRPIVERTLLSYPGITKVEFGLAP